MGLSSAISYPDCLAVLKGGGAYGRDGFINAWGCHKNSRTRSRRHPSGCSMRGYADTITASENTGIYALCFDALAYTRHPSDRQAISAPGEIMVGLCR
nr:MAG TPA: hypothetical protein [Caudoviricetes sp.]